MRQTPGLVCLDRLSNLQPVDGDVVIRYWGRRCIACRQPALRVLVVEGPRRDDDKEGEGGACEADVE